MGGHYLSQKSLSVMIKIGRAQSFPYALSFITFTNIGLSMNRLGYIMAHEFSHMMGIYDITGGPCFQRGKFSSIVHTYTCTCLLNN